jgi:F0F1-type ATP synthase epsilon subunit
MIAVGLVLYALSLILQGNQWYLAISGGILMVLGAVSTILGFLSRVRNLERGQDISDSDVEAATQRVLHALEKDGGPGRLIRIRPRNP